MPSEIVKKCSRLIAAQNLKIAFAESATAGRMCAEFSCCDDSGKILRGGIACYEVFVKETILKVPPALIRNYSAESAEVTEVLARNAAAFFKSDITVAITGLTSPGGSENKDKPVGTMFIHICSAAGDLAHREVFKGTPEQVVLQTIDQTARLLIKILCKK